MYHRRFYPDDVDVSVPYVAPLNFSAEDDRIYNFLKNVSTEECRKKVEDYQKLMLSRRDEIQSLFDDYINENNITFSIGNEAALEYCVLEYSFAYWQWGRGNCENIPTDTATAQKLFDNLNGYRIFSFISDNTEIGFYDYEIEQFGDLINHVDGSNKIFYPTNVDITFDYSVMKDINDWMQYEGNNFIFIYGEVDPWSATSVELTGKTNSIKMVNPGGAHWSRIQHFPEVDKQLIYSKLEEWLGIEIVIP
jgi:hypothetical protein